VVRTPEMGRWKISSVKMQAWYRKAHCRNGAYVSARWWAIATAMMQRLLAVTVEKPAMCPQNEVVACRTKPGWSVLLKCPGAQAEKRQCGGACAWAAACASGVHLLQRRARVSSESRQRGARKGGGPVPKKPTTREMGEGCLNVLVCSGDGQSERAQRNTMHGGACR